MTVTAHAPRTTTHPTRKAPHPVMTPEKIAALAADPDALAAHVAEDLEQPASAAEQLANTIYALQRLQRCANVDPAVLYLVAPDLAELYSLAIPAADVVDELTETAR